MMCLVLGQNGRRQNGTDKMVYGQNIIESSINPAPVDHIIVFINPALNFDAFGFPLCAYNLFVTLGNKIYIELNYIKMYIRYEIVPICPYHFVRTILSKYHFVRTILSGHHVFR